MMSRIRGIARDRAITEKSCIRVLIGVSWTLMRASRLPPVAKPEIDMTCKPRARVRLVARPVSVTSFAVVAACAMWAGASIATDADDYRRQAAQRDVAMFDVLDRNKDGRLTIEEVGGDIDWEARFNDLDINRDGVITREELTRYIALRYGIVTATK